MKKSFLFLLLVVSTSVVAYSNGVVANSGDTTNLRNGSKTSSTLSSTVVKDSSQALNSGARLVSGDDKQAALIKGEDEFSLGLGLGMDYGGIGGSLLFYPSPNVGLFCGMGYALAGAGYNVGAKFRFASKQSSSVVKPYILAMYGYNAAIVVDDADEYNKLFYGLTVGAGIDYKSSRSGGGYWTVALLIPIRRSGVQTYIDDLKNYHGVEFKNELLPIGLSIGYRIILN